MKNTIKNTDTNITDKTVSLIHDRISVELLKRGFSAPVELSIWPKDRQKIKLQSEPFLTTPILFKEIRIQNFGGDYLVSPDTQELFVWIPVNVAYEHFTGGTNGCEIFTFYCTVSPDSDDILNVSIR